MSRRWIGPVVALWMLGWCAPRELAAGDGRFSVIVKGNLITRTELFTAPNSVDPIAREQSFELTDFAGAGIEVVYEIPTLNLAVGLGADYLRAVQPAPVRVLPSRIEVPIDDGYEAIPVEATGYFILPFSGESFRMFIGGGIGVYFGRRVYSIAGTEAETLDRSRGMGIHVLGGVAYRFTNRFFVQAEMKFRDLQFRTTNRFGVARIPFGTTSVQVGQEPFESRVQTDGILFQIGLGVTL